MTEQIIAEIATRDLGSTLSERRRPDRVEYQSPELIALLRRASDCGAGLCGPLPEAAISSGASYPQSALKSAAQIGKRGFDLVFAALLLAQTHWRWRSIVLLYQVSHHGYEFRSCSDRSPRARP
jgi:hypothetical protein